MNIQVHKPIYSWTKFQRVPHKPNFPELLKKVGNGKNYMYIPILKISITFGKT